MHASYSRLIGAVCLLGSLKLLADAMQSKAAGGIFALLHPLGASEGTMLLATALLGLIGSGFGLRALIWRRVCIGACPAPYASRDSESA